MQMYDCLINQCRYENMRFGFRMANTKLQHEFLKILKNTILKIHTTTACFKFTCIKM